MALTLLRPSSLFFEDLSKINNFSDEKYGSVKKVYVICTEDVGVSTEFQQWMGCNAGVEHVMKINGSDHMPMFSTPTQLLHCLLHIALNYA